jgi:hypothetical protein
MNIVGKFVDLPGFAAHVSGLTFSAWRPLFVVVHNTSEPDLATYAGWREHPERHGNWTPEQWGRNLASYYGGLGWGSGPHAFVCPDGVLLFSPLNAPGTHSPSWNGISLGIETVGEFEREQFDGSPSQANLVAVLAVLHAKLGLDPYTIRFHKEDVRTTHRSCPGRNMVKPQLIEAVVGLMAEHNPGDHHEVPAAAHIAPAEAAPQAPPAAEPPPAPLALDAEIAELAKHSAIASYHWHDRGEAPAAYVEGMALAYAQTYRRLLAGHPAAIEMAKANTQDDSHDALAWYDSRFAALGMSNDVAGADTLRHLFVLMLGVGMRESSGQHCCGRDRSASNTSADTAEAGLFQTSYNAHACSPLFDQVMDEFAAGKAEGYLAVFSHNVSCSAADWANYGSGRGYAFQELCKKQPAFAAESAGITLRNLRRHYGTVNRKEAEVRKEADDLFLAVQRLVDQRGRATS